MNDRNDKSASRRLAVFLIVCVGVLSYLDSFQGAFVYDERNFITNNPTIRNFWPPWQTLLAPINVNRPLIGLSNAINYAISGLNPWSYHIVNLIIHLVAGLALFGIVRRTLGSGALSEQFGKNSTVLALVVSLIWVVHPLQTQSVTYVIQRCESLMGMFYLLTLYCVIRSLDSTRKYLWHGAAVAACAAGMMSKQVMVTAPLVVLLYDFLFGGGSVKEALRKRWPLYAGLAFTWCILLATIIAAPINDTAGFAVKSISSWDYCKSEFGVIVYYLRLAFWPDPLCLDYSGWPQARAARQIVPYAIIDCALLAGSVWAIFRRRPAGFLGGSFFLILSLTSSIMPFSDFVFEHRMYLPLAPLVAFVVLGSYSLGKRLLQWLPSHINPQMQSKRFALVLTTVIVVILGFATARRNVDYKTELTMWSDVVHKRPDNARAHNNLGEILADRNDFEEAKAQFYDAVRLDPTSYEAQFNLGNALALQGNLDEAKSHLMEALRINPDRPNGHFALGTILAAQGHMEAAANEFGTVVESKPDFAEAHQRLGLALEREGRIAEAKGQYEVVLQLRPDWPGLRDHVAALQ